MNEAREGRIAFVHLLPLLRDPRHCCTMALADWDATVRLARQSRLLGLLAHRLAGQDDLWGNIPEQVKGHLRAAMHVSAHRVHSVRMELRAIEAAVPSDIRVVLLKGAAYIGQAMPLATGRIPSDVDLLVGRAELERTEAALRMAGWRSEIQDGYDERYYREWSHEVPPMRFPGHALEVDLHHTIAPVTSRIRVDDALLFSAVERLPNSRYAVLAPPDQIIHAALHLFQDSEFKGRLRDLVDIDGLIRNHLVDEATWSAFFSRVERHKAGRLVWYALHYCSRWLATPVPAHARLEIPPWWARRGVDWMFSRCCPPALPDRSPGLQTRLALMAARVRYHWLRMPPGLLVRHAAHKAWRTIGSRSAGSAATQ